MPNPDVPFPTNYPEPYGTHRRECGKALYDAMGVRRDDGPARHAAWLRNFVAFDAPHIAIICIDRRFGFWAGIDVGCWLQSVMLLAEEEGLATCAQASLSLHPEVLRPLLGIGDDMQILFGLASGETMMGTTGNPKPAPRRARPSTITFSK